MERKKGRREGGRGVLIAYSETCLKDHRSVSRDHLSIKTTWLGPKAPLLLILIFVQRPPLCKDHLVRSFAIDFNLCTETTSYKDHLVGSQKLLCYQVPPLYKDQRSLLNTGFTSRWLVLGCGREGGWSKHSPTQSGP